MNSGDGSVWLPKLSIFLSGIAFAGFGVVLFAAPQVLEMVGVEITRPAGAVELRAFYGGLELGIAAFFFIALSRPGWYRAALILQILALGGAAVARGLALMIGGGEWLVLALTFAEGGGAVVGWIALRTLDRSDEATGDTARSTPRGPRV